MFRFFPYILKRLSRHWQILLTLIIGVMLATGLLASAPLLVDTVIQFGLRNRLENAEPEESNIFFTSASTDYSPEEIAEISNAIDLYLVDFVGGFLEDAVYSIGSRFLYPFEENAIIDDHRIQFYFMDRIEEQIEFIDGEWPVEISQDEHIFEGVIGENMALEYDLAVGDLLPLSTNQSDDVPEVFLRVSGIVRPLEYGNNYWFGNQNPISNQGNENWQSQYGIIVPFDYFFEASEFVFDRVTTVISYRAIIDHSSIRAEDIGGLVLSINSLWVGETRLPVRLAISTELDTILGEFDQQTEGIRVPLYVLTVQGVLLALYYVVMISALALQQVEREFAVLGSRGASRSQIFRIQLGEASLIAIIAVISGPVVGKMLIQGLVYFGPLQDVAFPGWGINYTQSSLLAAIVGASACFLALLLPLGASLNRSIIQQTQSLTRDDRVPVWQKFYLDVFVLIAGLIFFVRVRLYGGIGGFIEQGAVEQGGVDWLLLLSPIALAVGAATIMLRVFPLLLRAFEKISSFDKGLTSLLAMWQSARNPNHVARLVLLLSLAMSLGLFAIGLNATLSVSEFERSMYASGADLRISYDAPPISIDSEFIENSTILWRGVGKFNFRPYYSFEILAVDPVSFLEVGYFRDDFSNQTFEQLMQEIQTDSGEIEYLPGITLPGVPEQIGVWLFDEMDDGYVNDYLSFDGLSDLERLTLRVKIGTANGYYFIMPLLPVENEIFDKEHFTPGLYGWTLFNGNLPEFPEECYPLEVISFNFRQRAITQRGDISTWARLSFWMDDIITVEQDGIERIAFSFEDPTVIWMAGERGYSSFTRGVSRTGEASMQLDLGLGNLPTGISLTRPISPTIYPVIVDQVFLDQTASEVGDLVPVLIQGAHVLAEIRGVIDYFPTLYEVSEGGFMVIAYDPLMDVLNYDYRSTHNLNEYWAETSGDVSLDVSEIVENNPEASLFFAEDIRRIIKTDAMALGLRSSTMFGFLITTLLSLVGFATYFFISAKKRATTYGILRALGLSPDQLYFSLVWEQFILIIFGLGLGTGLGRLINQITLAGLPITLGDVGSVPPFVPQSDWMMVVQLALGLLVAFLLTLGFATLLLWRARIHRALRIGEE